MKVSYFNIGCKVNFSELSQIREEFEKLGYESVDFGEEADIVIINTCTVTANADADSRKYIRRARRISPNAFIAVTGCYAQLNPMDIASIAGVGAVFGMNYKFQIPKILNSSLINEPKIYCDKEIDKDFHPACSIDNESHTRVVLKIQDGCDYYCSYCAVPYARGNSRSMEYEKIFDKIKEIQEAGYYEIVLTGINLGTYKSPTGENFEDLIQALHKSDFNLRFRISSIEPELITDKLIEIVAGSTKICPHLHIPLQSGSDEILKLMKRRYKVHYFRQLIDKIYNANPNICIGLDIITGFPGETEKEFLETYNLLEETAFSYLHVFSYSDREITKSSKMDNKVAHSIKKERTHILRALSEKKKYNFYNSQIGKELIVIPETYDKTTGLWFGWTENYVRVGFKSLNEIKYIPIQIKAVDNCINYTKGELI